MVAVWVLALDSLPPLPVQAEVTVCFGWKLAPLAVTVTWSPDQTSAGDAEQLALTGTGGAPPNMNSRPVESRTLFWLPLKFWVLSQSAWASRSPKCGVSGISSPPPIAMANAVLLVDFPKTDPLRLFQIGR